MTPLSCFCFYWLSLFTLGSSSAAALWETHFIPNRRWFLSCKLQNFQVSLHCFFFVLPLETFPPPPLFSFYSFLTASCIPPGPTLTWHAVKNVSCKTGETCFQLAHMKDSVHVRDRLFWFCLCQPRRPGVRPGSMCQNSAKDSHVQCVIKSRHAGHFCITMRWIVRPGFEFVVILPIVARLLQRQPNDVTFAYL